MESDSLPNLTLKLNTLVAEVYSPTEVYSPKLQRCVPLQSGTLQDNRVQEEKNLEMGKLLFSMLPIVLGWLELARTVCRLVNGRATGCQ